MVIQLSDGPYTQDLEPVQLKQANSMKLVYENIITVGMNLQKLLEVAKDS
jgi:hypothetical protein